MPLPRSDVEAQRDLVELVLAVHRQVRALGQVLTQQAVGVFVAAAPPGGCAGRRSRPPHRCARSTHRTSASLALIVGQRLAQGGRDALQGLAELPARLRRWSLLHLGQDHEATAALDQRADRRAIAGALDADHASQWRRDQPVFDLGRAQHPDALQFGIWPTSILTAAARLAGVRPAAGRQSAACASRPAGSRRSRHRWSRATPGSPPDRGRPAPVSRRSGCGDQRARTEAHGPASAQRWIVELARHAAVCVGRGPLALAPPARDQVTPLRRTPALAADRARGTAQRAGNRTQTVTGFQTVAASPARSSKLSCVVGSHRQQPKLLPLGCCTWSLTAAGLNAQACADDELTHHRR